MKTLFLAIALTFAAAPAAMAAGTFSYGGEDRPAVSGVEWKAPEGHKDGRRYSRGDQLPKIYREESNYLDISKTGFKEPSARQVWVRVGTDAYLISRSSGLIEQVVRGVYN